MRLSTLILTSLSTLLTSTQANFGSSDNNWQDWQQPSTYLWTRRTQDGQYTVSLTAKSTGYGATQKEQRIDATALLQNCNQQAQRLLSSSSTTSTGAQDPMLKFRCSADPQLTFPPQKFDFRRWEVLQSGYLCSPSEYKWVQGGTMLLLPESGYEESFMPDTATAVLWLLKDILPKLEQEYYDFQIQVQERFSVPRPGIKGKIMKQTDAKEAVILTGSVTGAAPSDAARKSGFVEIEKRAQREWEAYVVASENSGKEPYWVDNHHWVGPLHGFTMHEDTW